MKTILVLTSFSKKSEHAAEFAVKMAEILIADIHVLHVSEPEPASHKKGSGTGITVPHNESRDKEMQLLVAFLKKKKQQRFTGIPP